MAKKVLYKIAKEEELKEPAPTVEEPKEMQPLLEVAEDLPVVEPEPVATDKTDVDVKPTGGVDTMKSKPVPKTRGKKTLFEPRTAGPGPEPKNLPEAAAEKAKPKEMTWIEKEFYRALRLEKQRKLNIDLIPGITVGGRAQLKPKNAKRITRDRRRERLLARESMKIIIDGEEKDVSETSKYMLDMLIKDKKE